MRKIRMSIIAALGSIIASLVNTGCSTSNVVLYGPGPDWDRNDTISNVDLYGCPPVEDWEETPVLYGPAPIEKK